MWTPSLKTLRRKSGTLTENHPGTVCEAWVLSEAGLGTQLGFCVLLFPINIFAHANVKQGHLWPRRIRKKSEGFTISDEHTQNPEHRPNHKRQ